MPKVETYLSPENLNTCLDSIISVADYHRASWRGLYFVSAAKV